MLCRKSGVSEQGDVSIFESFLRNQIKHRYIPEDRNFKRHRDHT
jgi:hypothetical protein